MAINYDLNNTGPEVQERLDQVMPNKADIEQEALDRQAGDNALQEQITAINNEIGESGQGGETINGRLDTLEAAVGDGGSVDERIAASAAELVGTATEDYDTLGKVEGVIEQNKADQQDVNDDTYRKNETYSKEQLDNLITTPDQQWAVAEATEETTDVTDVLPDTGAADTIYRVAFWDGTQYDDTAYSMYAWDGTHYVLLAVRTLDADTAVFNVTEYNAGTAYASATAAANAIPAGYRKSGLLITFQETTTGDWLNYQFTSDDPTNDWLTASAWQAPFAYQLGVFDISAYHATGGTLATYADLAAALGTNGANVPPAYRKGGMSIKFVCSSDNKYVQARCMAQNFTTDVTQWQGVDDAPTAGSDNLVKSGGVYDKFNTLNNKLILLQGIAASKTSSGVTAQGQYYYNTGTKKIYVCTEYTGDLSTSTFVEVPFEDGAIYTYSSELYIWNGTDLEDVERARFDMEYFRDLVAHSYPGPILEDGKVVNGFQNMGASYWHTDYILARRSGGVYNIQALSGSGNAYVWFYDEDFNLIGKKTADSSGVVDYYSFSENPSGTMYVRFNFAINNANSYIWNAHGFVADEKYYEDITSSLTSGQIAKNSGNVGELKTIEKQVTSGYASIVLGVKKGDSFIIDGVGGSGARIYMIADADGRIVSVASANSTMVGGLLNIGQDGVLSVNVATSQTYRIVRCKNEPYILGKQKVKTDISSLLEPFGVQNAGTVGSTITLSLATRSYLHAIINVKAGEDYMISCSAGSTLRCFALQDSNGVILDVATGNISESNRLIHICKDGVLSVNVNPTLDYSIYKFVELDSPSEFITPVINEYIDTFTDNSLLKQTYEKKYKRAYAGGISNYFVIPNEGNEQIRFDVQTTTTGFPLLIYLEYENGEMRTVYQPKEFNGECSVPVTLTGKLTRINIYAGSTATNGTMDVTIAISPTLVPNVADFSFKKKYQFGRTCNFKYESPQLVDVPEHTFRTGDTIIPTQPHTVGAVLNVFYDLYDALMTQYPNYVEKVDCDALALAEGIDKSDYPYMEGLNTYMYKFIAPDTRTPDTDITKIKLHKPKLFIVSGTHAEYEGMYDVIHMMQRICNSWNSDSNLEELRWNVDIYVMPCSAAWTDDNGIRCPIEYDGDTPIRALRADPNRNTNASDWKYTDPTSEAVLNGHDWSGNEPADLYETKVFELMYDSIMPDVFIDRHNAYLPNHAANDMIYSVSKQALVRDCCNELVSMMTRSWKRRFCYENMPANPTEEEDKKIYIFPSNNDDYTTLLGSVYGATERGMRQNYAAERGALALTAESKIGTVYYHGQIGDATHNYDQSNTRLTYTCGMEALINLCCRLLAIISYSTIK